MGRIFSATQSRLSFDHSVFLFEVFTVANLNKVFLMGNITRDIDLKFLPNQTPVAEFGMAINRTWNDSSGNKKEEVTFVDCTCFGKLAEVLGQYKKKGDPLFIEGRLKLDQWEAQDGTKRSKIRVIVETFQFLNKREGNGEGRMVSRDRPHGRGGAQGAAAGGLWGRG
jgi:single-strand DNA-binding protein